MKYNKYLIEILYTYIQRLSHENVKTCTIKQDSNFDEIKFKQQCIIICNFIDICINFVDLFMMDHNMVILEVAYE